MLSQRAYGSFWAGLCIIGSCFGAVACGSDDGQGVGATPVEGGANEASTHPEGSITTGGGGSMTGAEGGMGPEGGDAAAGSGCRIPATEDAQPTLLSQTGCVDPKDPTKPIAAMIPYDVNSPLWSDGAKKERFMMVPPGKKIHVKDCTTEPTACAADGGASTPEDEGHWDVPPGTVLMKTFSIGGKRVETRLFMRVDASSWLAFSYEWNGLGAAEMQTEATLLDNALDKPLPSQPPQTWHFPGRAQCFECHTTEAGHSLGPSTQQFNRNFDYASGTKNQVTAFADLGLFDAPPRMMPAYVTPTTAGDITQRARSYLQANCAICHRPGGQLADIDLRFTTTFKDTRLCNQAISKSGAELPPMRLVPGKPAQSTISYRMHDTVPGFCGPQPATCTNYRMPKIGSYVVDAEGSKLIDDWVTSIPANCMP